MIIDPSYEGWNRKVLQEKFGPRFEQVQVEHVQSGWIAHLVRNNEREVAGAPPTEIVGPVLAVYARAEAVFIQIPGCEIIGMPTGTIVEVIKS